MILAIALVAVGLLIAYLALWPTSFRPQRWQPPPAPSLDHGPFARNRALAAMERIPLGDARGPETVTVAADGTAYTGVDGGALLRIAPGAPPERIVDTGGRVDGVALDHDGSLVLCDCYRGLLRVRDGEITVLAAPGSVPGLRFCNDLAIAADGSIYFTCSSARYDVHDDVLALLEHQPTGSLMRYLPAADRVEVVLDGLHFANGVTLGPNEDYLLVVETGAYRVRRLWLRGDRAGQDEIFVDNLPGFPDNIRLGGGGIFWLAIASVRDAMADRVLFPRPGLRRAVARLPRVLLPGPRPHAIILGFDGAGHLRHNLQDDSRGCFRQISCVEEHDGQLWIGSFQEPAIGRLPVPAAR